MSGLRILLAPFALLYGIVVAVRHLLFDMGVLSTTKVNVPVISVGNISAGGTGKTPLVEYLARYFREHGKKVAIISRGYKRNTTGYVVVSNGAQRCADAAESGDEPSLLADKLDGVVVVVDEKRVRAAKQVIGSFKPDVILLDDGFQHRYLHRDLNIAVVPAGEASWLLPVGNLREPLSALRRADIVVVSRCTDEQMFSNVRNLLADRMNKPVAGMRFRLSVLRNLETGDTKDLKSVAGTKVVAFSGIGDPEQFEVTLKSLSVDIKQHHRFADHHRFTASDIEAIERSYAETRSEMIVTTEKDIARLKGDRVLTESFLKRNPVHAVEIQVEFIAGKEQFDMMLAKVERT
ncbi:MAG: tetraacyldisaccharide 4'-kinase [Ignavibacteriae bacterium]|nr:tetraacyldisaccharide 4'-kinase [Ignavibacteriota bacterium]